MFSELLHRYFYGTLGKAYSEAACLIPFKPELIDGRLKQAQVLCNSEHWILGFELLILGPPEEFDESFQL